MQQLVLAAPVGGHRFLLECQFHCDYLPSQTHVAHFTALNIKKHDLVISPTCWHYKAGDIAPWVHSEHRQGKVLGQRDAEGEQIFYGKLMGREGSACFCVFLKMRPNRSRQQARKALLVLVPQKLPVHLDDVTVTTMVSHWFLLYTLLAHYLRA
ncbi:unnamed protein product [Rangifer tarandus platyrhynchus]|uniref:Uncharacterized protein n=1 Tax=Rangifer tarandus platyrhynchus TaxID=3082113 RepID=A0AC59Z260_RANTA